MIMIASTDCNFDQDSAEGTFEIGKKPRRMQ
jgi:hypothetical protein